MKESLQKDISVSIMPPKEVDRLFFENRGKFKVFTYLSVNFPGNNALPTNGGNSPPFAP